MTCICGHVADEHDEGFFNPCAVEGCDCGDFEASDEPRD